MMSKRLISSRTLLSKAVFVAILSTPALISLNHTTAVSSENRALADFPPRPRSWEGILKYPASLDAWINDHFGLRDRLAKLNNRVRYALFRQFPTIQVIQGREGRIFLSAHATTHEPYSAILLPCGHGYDKADQIAGQLNRFSKAARETGADLRLLAVPSAPVLHADQLPGWLEDKCNSNPRPVPRILASPRLEASAKALVYYPEQEMLDLRRRTDIIPPNWFHWNGTGVGTVAQLSTHHFWGKDAEQATPVVTQKQHLQSDIAHLFPGVKLGSDIETIDFAASGITQCLGAGCFPELRSLADKLVDVSRYRNPSGKDRLILLSDSFGSQISGWYARHFAEVVHLSTNNLDRLDKSEVAQLRGALFKHAGGSKILFLYHDGSLLYGRLGMDLDRLGL